MSGFSISSIAETLEMQASCAEKKITADVELIKADEINMTWESAHMTDVKYRRVIDQQT